MTTSTKTPLVFIDKVRAALEEHGLALTLIAKDSLDFEEGVIGGFHPEFGIEIAARQAGWLPCLAHEFGHFEQSLEGHPDFSASAYDFQEWLSGKSMPAARVLKLTRSLQRLERDAERRAIRYCREYRLGDAEAYARTANRYVLSFEIARRHRQWPGFRDDSASAFPSRLLPEARIGDHPLLERLRARAR